MKGFLYYSAYANIAETIRMDAACGRRAFGNPNAAAGSLATASMNAQATPELFVLAARQYLATAGASVCKVEMYDPAYAEWSCGFTAKREDDFLYVTSADPATGLTPGMRIVAVGKNTIPFLLKDTGADIFWGRGTDREDWDLVYRMYDSVDVFPGDGHVKRLDLLHLPRGEEPAPVFSATSVTDNAVLVRVDSLADLSSVQKTVSEVERLLATQSTPYAKLILDLRSCTGDAVPEAFLALLPYLVDAAIPAKTIMGDRKVWTIYSKHNAERLIDALNKASGSADPALLQDMIDGIEQKAAQVLEAKRSTLDQKERHLLAELPEVIPSPFEDELVEPVPHAPKEVCILVDTTTGAGAEKLAESVMHMQKVKLIGRTTPGALDYENYLTIDYPDIMARFTYPITRTDANRQGQGYASRGLPLNIHIPWTHKECVEDVILKAALDL
ncbi:MAG: hypothetical protein IKE43_06015 [Coriobacteriales bacterium]|nr:hypothetical protein [Coriobacteriales bacterium]